MDLILPLGMGTRGNGRERSDSSQSAPTAMSGTVVFGGTRIPLAALFDYLDMERAFAGFSAASPPFASDRRGRHGARQDGLSAGIRKKILVDEHLP